MVVLGALLLVLAAVLLAGIVTSSTTPVDVEAFGTGLDGVSAGELFVLGACTGALAVVGFGLLLGGLARSRARRRSAKQEVRAVRGERESLAEENARLQAELEQRERDAAAYPAGTSADAGAVREDVDLPASDSERGRHRLTGR
ncbi:MAG: hypothetical protein Q8R60_04225 [Mycobacteriales bacterium]|nr:hypothetical protein [Mycobacteriales bacterium]